MLHPLFLFQPMVKICQEKVGKVLGKIIADWHTLNGIYNFIKQCQKAVIFYFAPDHLFQQLMVNGRVKLADIYFKAIPRAIRVLLQCVP